MQVTSSKESLSHALQSRIIPNQEYLLQGSILDSARDHLINRYEKKNGLVQFELVKYKNAKKPLFRSSFCRSFYKNQECIFRVSKRCLKSF